MSYITFGMLVYLFKPPRKFLTNQRQISSTHSQTLWRFWFIGSDPVWALINKHRKTVSLLHMAEPTHLRNLWNIHSRYFFHFNNYSFVLLNYAFSHCEAGHWCFCSLKLALNISIKIYEWILINGGGL